MQQCVSDLLRHGHLVCVDQPVDACLEAAEIHRRVFQSGGPAIWFRQVRGCQFSMVSNLYGSMERVRFIFRDTLHLVQQLIQAKIAPESVVRHAWTHRHLPRTAWHMLPRMRRRGPVLRHQTNIASLPQLQSWPQDGGAFVTLPAVYTENLQQPGWRHSNVGMYRVQLSGGKYRPDHEIGMHYQIHRGIGIHHTAAVQSGRPLPVSIFVGGSPAMAVAAVMPLPENVPEITFAGALAGHRMGLIRLPGLARCMRTPTSVSAVLSIPIACCRKDHLAIIWAITAWPTTSPFCGYSGCTIAQGRSGRLPWSGDLRRRTPCSEN